jgi:hypothetical protein
MVALIKNEVTGKEYSIVLTPKQCSLVRLLNVLEKEERDNVGYSEFYEDMDSLFMESFDEQTSLLDLSVNGEEYDYDYEFRYNYEEIDFADVKDSDDVLVLTTFYKKDKRKDI